MSNIPDQEVRKTANKLRVMPYIILGFLVFYLNSLASFNYFFKGYMILLECQAGIVGIYFLLRYLKPKF
ncbi:MAG TPA: hypothetical protein DCF68_20310 [Cyanothece sp. UBA12306]|nr:hypothetical protein [Cyanothece sp. UBA12306]